MHCLLSGPRVSLSHLLDLRISHQMRLRGLEEGVNLLLFVDFKILPLTCPQKCILVVLHVSICVMFLFVSLRLNLLWLERNTNSLWGFPLQRWVSEKFIVEGLRDLELFGGKSSIAASHHFRIRISHLLLTTSVYENQQL